MSSIEDNPNRSIHKIDVGSLTEKEAEAIIEKYRESFGKKSFSDIVKKIEDKS